ncbi:HotDog domain-containing protein [Xylariomycetidae sp. FL0641]|nr:HotDog domain-containing protein [Xylariomycetidae sp. FL0641]
MDNMEKLSGIQKIERYLERSRDSKEGWSAAIVSQLSVVSHSPSLPHPSVTFRLKVQPIHANGLDNLHGGCASTIFDICTTMPLYLINKPGFWQSLGVSRTLNCTYLRPVPVGTTVDIECEIVQVGKKLCALRGVMRAVTDNGKQGPVLVICEHGKVSTDPVVEKL